MTNVLKRERKEETGARRKGHVQREAGFCGTCLPSKAWSQQKLEEAGKDLHPDSSRKAEPRQHLDLGLGSSPV